MSVGVLELLLILLVLSLVLAAFVWWLAVLIQALKVPDQAWEAAGQNKLIYVLLMILLGVVGTFLYVVVARPPLRAVGANA